MARKGILKGVRGKQGGYQLVRAPHQITVEDILGIAEEVAEGREPPISGSALVKQVVAPPLAEAEAAFFKVLARTTVENLKRSAVAMRK